MNINNDNDNPKTHKKANTPYTLDFFKVREEKICVEYI